MANGGLATGLAVFRGDGLYVPVPAVRGWLANKPRSVI